MRILKKAGIQLNIAQEVKHGFRMDKVCFTPKEADRVRIGN